MFCFKMLIFVLVFQIVAAMTNLVLNHSERNWEYAR
jgi:hypothetical protein